VVAFRERVRREVFKGQDAKGAHRTGSGKAAVAILGYAAAACGAYLFHTGLTTGFLLGKPASWPPCHLQLKYILPCCHASQSLKLKYKACQSAFVPCLHMADFVTTSVWIWPSIHHV